MVNVEMKQEKTGIDSTSYLVMAIMESDISILRDACNGVDATTSDWSKGLYPYRKDVEVDWSYYKDVLTRSYDFKSTEEYVVVTKFLRKLEGSIKHGTLKEVFGVDLDELKYTGLKSDVKAIVHFLFTHTESMDTEIGDEVFIVDKELVNKHYDLEEELKKAEEGLDILMRLAGYKTERLGIPMSDYFLKVLNENDKPVKRLRLPINRSTKKYIKFKPNQTLISFTMEDNLFNSNLLNRLITELHETKHVELVNFSQSNGLIFFNVLCKVNIENSVINEFADTYRELMAKYNKEFHSTDHMYSDNFIFFTIERSIGEEIQYNHSFYLVNGKKYAEFKPNFCEMTVSMYGFTACI